MKPAKVRSALAKKGFSETEGARHRKFCLYINGQQTRVRTMMSRGPADIRIGVVRAMAKQLHLSVDDFEDLINCPLSADEYVQKLRELGVVPVA